jgi:hypothetical protein
MTQGEIIFGSINVAILIVTLIAVWRAPIQAVKVGQRLQDEQRATDRAYLNKFSVLAVIIGERHAKGFSRFFIMSMNQVPIVFNENRFVLIAYTKFIDEHKKTLPDGVTKNENLIPRLNDLIVEMGRDLGYQMNNDWIEDFFYPRAAEAEFLARHGQDEDYLQSRYSQRQNDHTPQGEKVNGKSQEVA